MKFLYRRLAWLLLGPAAVVSAADNVVTGSEGGRTDEIKINLGGVFIEDGTWLRGVSSINAPDNHWRRRRATLEASLEWNSVELVVEGGHNNGNSFVWRDAFVALNLPGPYSVRAGLMKPEFGHAWTTSLKNLWILERSVALDMVDLNRAPGIEFAATPGDHRAVLGFFEYEDDNGEAVNFAQARYLFEHEGDNSYWQAGFSLAHQDYDRAIYRIRSRAETTAMDNFLRTERITSEYANYGAVELVVQRGRLAVLAEAITTELRSPREGDRQYAGGFVQASWMLTADSHRIGEGSISRLNPTGIAAVELVLSAGMTDAYSENNGFEADTRSVGLNLYQGNHVKVMAQLDWLHVTRGLYAGQSGLATMWRLQYRF